MLFALCVLKWNMSLRQFRNLCKESFRLLLFKDVRAHCYCASLVCMLFIRHTRATSSISSAHTELKLNKIERFSFECRKVIGFALSMPHDWLKKFAPLFHPIRSKTKTNRDVFECIFPHFASATCNYLKF